MKMDDVIKLDNQLCFPLYVCSREIIKKYKPVLSKLDLTYTQYITMMVLWEKSICRVNELGKILYLDSGTLTPLLKKLETKGYIKRVRDKKDERNLNIVITDKGIKLKNDAIMVPNEIKKCINLSDDEIIILYKLLYKLINNMEGDVNG